MYGNIDPNGYSFLTGLTSNDQCYLNEKLNPYQAPPPDNPQAPREWANGCGESCSPVVINFNDGGYELAGTNDPVSFDMAGSGIKNVLGWTVRGADEAFLWLDRDHSGTVTGGRELFGNFTPLKSGGVAPNGFVALKDHDDNHDGVIDAHDAIWPQLMLWRDLNHDGISQTAEIMPVTASSLVRIELGYHWTGRRDRWGNVFRYEAKAWIANPSGQITPRPVYDIFFIHVN
jgi:hypothetical protein